jgi:phosphoribosylanthranilate isomerase
MVPRVKVCCISSVAEVDIAVAAGADLLGFVAPPLGGLGVLPVEAIAKLIPLVPPGITPVLLTGEQDVDAISAQLAATRPGAIQLVKATTAATRRTLQARFPSLRILQVVHVHGDESIEDAKQASVGSDALVLDSQVADQLGATGTTHDWSISARIVQAIDVPVFLAGGLNEDNAAVARTQVVPFGLDLCSSVRTDGVLDPVKVRRFLAAARG